MTGTSVELDELFDEVKGFIKTTQPVGSEPYGRGKDYNLKQVMEDIARGVRTCSRCLQVQPISMFSKRHAHVTGYKAWCKSCDKKAWDTHYYKDVEKSRKAERVRSYKKYGLDTELAEVLANYKNRIQSCPICGRQECLVLDHDHRTGAVRALLCNRCNTLLGKACDDTNILHEAIAYLEYHRRK